MAVTARKTPLAFSLLLLLLTLGHAVASRLNITKQKVGRQAKYDPWDDPSNHGRKPLGIAHLNRTLYNIISSAHSFQKQGKPADGTLKEAIGLLDAMVLDLLGRLQSGSNEQQKQTEKECNSVTACQTELQAAKEIVAEKKAEFETIMKEHTSCRTEEVKAKNMVMQCKAVVFVTKQLSMSTCQALTAFEDSAGNAHTHMRVVNRAPGESVKDYLSRMTTHFCGKGDGGCSGILCQWTEKENECKAAKANLTAAENDCNMKVQSYNNQRMACNAVQKRMDRAACKYALFAKQACENYNKCHAQTIKPYLVLKANAVEHETARKNQWRIMMRMRCMLKVLQNEGYKPNDKVLAECKHKPKDSYNPAHLDLTFKCNLEAQPCTKAKSYPGADLYSKMLANLPKDAPAEEPVACSGLGEGVGDLVRKNMDPGAHDMIGNANKGLTEEIYFFPQQCDYPDLQARRPTIARRVASLKFPPWPDQNEDGFASRFVGFIQIKKAGDYKFWIESRAGAKVYIDHEKVYQADLCREKEGAGIKGPFKIAIKEGFAPLRVEVHANRRPEKLVLKYQGPDTFGASTDVPADVLKKLAPSPLMIRSRRNGHLKVHPSTGTCTCDFTLHTNLFAFYVDGIDMTSKVKGDHTVWDEKNTLRFPCGEDTLLAVSGGDSDKGCATGGFAMMCTSTDHHSPWHKYIADPTWKVFASTCSDGKCSADNNHILNAPAGWYLPAFDDKPWPHAVKGDTDKAQVVVGTPFDICGSKGPAWLFRSNIKAAL